jgi:UrcA family protein
MSLSRPIVAAAGLSLALASSAAIAQHLYGNEPLPPPSADQPPPPPPPYDYGPPTEASGVTVYAPRTVGRSAIGAPIEVHTEQVVVPTADLDLSSDWGMHALRYRIRRAAHDACEDLDQRYPVSADDGDDCYGRAVRRAFEDVAYQTGYAP